MWHRISPTTKSVNINVRGGAVLAAEVGFLLVLVDAYTIVVTYDDVDDNVNDNDADDDNL